MRLVRRMYPREDCRQKLWYLENAHPVIERGDLHHIVRIDEDGVRIAEVGSRHYAVDGIARNPIKVFFNGQYRQGSRELRNPPFLIKGFRLIIFRIT